MKKSKTRRKISKVNKKQSKKLIKTAVNKPKLSKEPDAVLKIIFYLSLSDLPEKTKKAFAEVLPSMTKSQQERLAELLESSFLDEATKWVDDSLKNKLAEIEKQYDSQ